MNKKGFTLVELLAVIIIISLLALLTSTSVTKILKDAKNDLSNIQIASIKAAAEAWGADNFNRLPKVNECKYLTLKDLKDYGLLDSNVIDPKNNQEISDNLKIKMTTTNSLGNLVTSYEVNPSSVTGCDKAIKPICTPATSSNKTLGNIPNGEYNIGDEYICDVSNSLLYHFFVIDVDQDTDDVILITEKNICSNGTAATSTNTCLIAWNSTGTDVREPITLDPFFNSLKSSWTNLDSDQIDLPTITQINATGCSNLNYSCPLWMYNYLSRYAESETRLTNISGVSYYWTKSFRSATSTTSNKMYIVSNSGTVYSDFTVTDNLGVRPIIILPKSSLN